MHVLRRLLVVSAVLLCGLEGVAASASVNPDWTTPLPPYKIADGVYYVGGRDLAAYLVTTPAGNILINSNYTSSPTQIRHSVEQLGFRWRDTKILLVSHVHVDHAGGAAATVRETGARYEVMDGDANVAESGGRTDFAFGPRQRFPAAHVDHVLHDGEAVALGGVVLTAHRTAGHTRGCTTWTMQVHIPGETADKRRRVVIVGSWSVLSEYRLIRRGGRSASYPGIAEDYEHTFALLHSLPCDVFLASHGGTFDMLAKLKRMPSEGDEVWVDPAGYAKALSEAQNEFEATYRTQAGGKPFRRGDYSVPALAATMRSSESIW